MCCCRPKHLLALHQRSHFHVLASDRTQTPINALQQPDCPMATRTPPFAHAQCYTSAMPMPLWVLNRGFLWPKMMN